MEFFNSDIIKVRALPEFTPFRFCLCESALRGTKKPPGNRWFFTDSGSPAAHLYRMPFPAPNQVVSALFPSILILKAV